MRQKQQERQGGQGRQTSPAPPAPPAPSATAPITIALASILSGAATGAAGVGVMVLVYRVGQAPRAMLDVGVLLGITVAATLAWRLGAPLPDGWRRAITAALAAFGGMILAALTAPADMAAGPYGVGAYIAVLLIIAMDAARRARRAAGS